MSQQWPAGLPIPRRDGYQVTGELPVVRTQMESGKARVHRVTGTIMRSISVSLLLNKTQVKIFWDFFNGEGNAGANFVAMPLVVGNAISNHLCRFTNYPSTTLKGSYFEISFSVETDEQRFV